MFAINLSAVPLPYALALTEEQRGNIKIGFAVRISGKFSTSCPNLKSLSPMV